MRKAQSQEVRPTFSGLMSPWHTPRPWHCASASSSWYASQRWCREEERRRRGGSVGSRESGLQPTCVDGPPRRPVPAAFQQAAQVTPPTFSMRVRKGRVDTRCARLACKNWRSRNTPRSVSTTRCERQGTGGASVARLDLEAVGDLLPAGVKRYVCVEHAALVAVERTPQVRVCPCVSSPSTHLRRPGMGVVQPRQLGAQLRQPLLVGPHIRAVGALGVDLRAGTSEEAIRDAG